MGKRTVRRGGQWQKDAKVGERGRWKISTTTGKEREKEQPEHKFTESEYPMHRIVHRMADANNGEAPGIQSKCKSDLVH